MSMSYDKPDGEQINPSSPCPSIAMLHRPDAHCCHDVVRQLNKASESSQAVPGAINVVVVVLVGSAVSLDVGVADDGLVAALAMDATARSAGTEMDHIVRCGDR